MAYFYGIHWSDTLLRAVPLILLGVQHFVIVERILRDELNQCLYLWNAANHYEIKYGMGRTGKDALCLGRLWSQMWIIISFIVNGYVAAMMTMYVVHSIAVTDPKKDDLMTLVLKMMGSLGVIDFDDKIMSHLPLWTEWYLMHHPKTRKAHAEGKSAEEAASGSGDEDDDHLRQHENPDAQRVIRGRSSLLIPRKWRHIPWETAYSGMGQDKPEKSQHGALWRAVDVRGDGRGSFLKLGFRFKDGKVTSVATSRPILHMCATHRELAKTKVKLQTACHVAAFRPGDHPHSHLFSGGRARGLKLGDEILFIGLGSHAMLEQSTSSMPDRALQREDPEALLLGWRVADEVQKDKVISRALSTLRGPDKSTWRHPLFLVLVKPKNEPSSADWEYGMSWLADTVHVFFYLIARCLMVGSFVFIFMVYYVDDYATHLGV
eukprot:TRINITY_DN15761_c0_g1_i6.p1 TRINITY_DN15761_c0_g1~~TRINITY_DN15761_c0_g1_i6.p1  ORF type:complete len:434 (+),score=86.86 TRINITY_DN15761_c0_g1_i6:1008-2309(+)